MFLLRTVVVRVGDPSHGRASLSRKWSEMPVGIVSTDSADNSRLEVNTTSIHVMEGHLVGSCLRRVNPKKNKSVGEDG